MATLQSEILRLKQENAELRAEVNKLREIHATVLKNLERMHERFTTQVAQDEEFIKSLEMRVQTIEDLI
jgi:cell division septum initiation protein DivIVA